MVIVACKDVIFQDIQAVFLDKDGTLADVSRYLLSLGKCQAQLMEALIPGTYPWVLQALGISSGGLDPAGLMAVGSRQETINGVAKVLQEQLTENERIIDLVATTLAAAARQHLPKASYTPLLSGVIDFLRRLRQAGLKVSMVSADAQVHLVDFVEHYQLQNYFGHLQGVSRQYPSKVTPDFLQAVCQAIDVTPHQALMIGDAATDLHVATLTGGFIGYLGGWSPLLSPEQIASKQVLGALQIPSAFVTDFSQIRFLRRTF
ncbi:MAG: HAD family hydrolase [Cyanobacteria bacterium P01_D01_bin.156]